MYKNILAKQTEEYNKLYKQICKTHPSWSKKDKSGSAIRAMSQLRGLSLEKVLQLRQDPFSDIKGYQYFIETFAISADLDGGIIRYYLKDDSLFEFFKSTEIKQKEVESILNSGVLNEPIGVLGQSFSFTIICFEFPRTDDLLEHTVTVLTDGMNYSFCVEEFNKKMSENPWVFNMAMNFLFYISAFPECVIDGVPNGVKRNPKALNVSISDKIVAHRTVEHGFIRPHFRSGYFRHLNSDYFVNCKGQIRFIASTMVKGRAKTVIKGGSNET